MGMFDDLIPQSQPAQAGAGGMFEDLIPVMNFDRPDAEVRADIGKLSGPARTRALDQWADRFVARERSQYGVGQGADDTVRTLTRGSFVGPFLDEANAATQKALQVATFGLAGSDYDEALAYQRAQDRAVDKEAPVLSTIGQIAGGVAGGVGAARQAGVTGAGLLAGGPLAAVAPAKTVAGNIAQGAGIGATYGAVHGFGNAQGGDGSVAEQAGERLGDAAGSAVMGGMVGGVLAPAISGAASAAGWVADAMSPQIARIAQGARNTADAISDRLPPSSRDALNRLMIAAGVRERPPSTGGAMAAAPPAPTSPADAAADQVIANQLSRAGVSVTDLRQTLSQHQRSRQFNDDSFAQDVLAPVDLDPSLQRLASSVARQQPEAGNVAAGFIYGRQKGETPPVPLPSTAGLPTKEKFAPVDANSPPIGQFERVKDAMRRAFGVTTASTHGFGNTAARVEEKLIEAARKEADTLYGDVYKSGQGVPLDKVVEPVLRKWRMASIDETEQVEKALQKFSSWVERSVAPAGQRHHIERFDKAKREIDDEIEKMIGRGDKEMAGPIIQFKNELLDAVDSVSANELGAKYARARDAFSSRMDMKDALALGRRLFNSEASIAVDQFKNLNAGQRKMARIGIVDSFEQNMGRKERSADITRIFESPRVQEIVESMIPRSRATKADPDPKFADRPERLGRYLQTEQRMIGTRDEVLGNSKTAQRLADDKSLNVMIDVIEDIKQTGGSATGMAMRLLQGPLEKMFGFRADTAAQIARKLFTADPAERDRVLLGIEKRLGPSRAEQFRQMMVENQRRIVQGTSGPASTGGQQPPPPPSDRGPTGGSPPPAPPPMRLGGPMPEDDGDEAPTLASIGIDAGRRSDAQRRRDTVSQIEPDPVPHYSTRMRRNDDGTFAPGSPRKPKASQGSRSTPPPPRTILDLVARPAA